MGHFKNIAMQEHIGYTKEYDMSLCPNCGRELEMMDSNRCMGGDGECINDCDYFFSIYPAWIRWLMKLTSVRPPRWECSRIKEVVVCAHCKEEV